MITTSRRSLITGLVSLIAAPAIVRAASLMPVKPIPGAWIRRQGIVYGRSPAMDVLIDQAELNAVKARLLWFWESQMLMTVNSST